ncbi:MAG: DUF1553 domain-containing protein, partial [Planctomycetaceae bacterium]|nr:DUF1553 domain-containing protein [Planctomycetaceae bacterium]
HRGEYLQPTEEVSAGSPEVLHNWPEDLPSNRLGFARWLVRSDNPLTARVVVNRQWAALFGRGIVETVEDFGVQGMPPSHPELLDWLAYQWMHQDHWSLKALHGRMVSSRTYRQASERRVDVTAIDPSNRLLAVSPRIRLEAEILRDTLVRAAGVLSLKQGGAPVRPLQPSGITEVTFGSPAWNADKGEDRYRRSVYTFQKRTAPFAMFATFDAPSGESCIVRRSRSNSPLQSLTLLNDVMLLDLAQVVGREFANREASEAGGSVNPDVMQSALMTELFQRLLTRAPEEDEADALLQFLDQQRSHFAQDPAAAVAFVSADVAGGDANADRKDMIVRQAAWTAIARALFCLDEVQNRP